MIVVTSRQSGVLGGWRMRLPSLDEGQTRFKPYHSGFREAARIAHGRWINKVRPEYAQCSLRVVRNNVTPLFAQEARTLLGGLNGIRFIDTRNKQTLTVFSPRAVGERPWVARYKHVDSNFRAHNIPTNATMRFDAQEDLADVPSGSIYFTLAYQMAGPESELVGPFIIL